MHHNDLTFFTNEPERDLYSRFSKILNSYTQFFDILVGYFRTSGFFNLYQSMQDIEKIRVLVGLNVDRRTIDIINQAEAEIAFEVCAARYERGSIIITTNLEFPKWTEVLGDEQMTAALLDRLTHNAHILNINGDSYRFKQALAKQTETT